MARRGGALDDDVRTEIEHAVVAVMASAGHTVTRVQAAQLVVRTLAGHRPRDPRAYVIATVKRDPAAAYRAVAVSATPPPPSPELLGKRPGGPAAPEVVHARAADARAMMAAKRAPADDQEAPGDEPDW